MKKIVHYDNSKDFHIRTGASAFLYTVDHPDSEHVSNTKMVRTSAVESYDEKTGEFQTRNSIYRPVSSLLRGL